MYGLERQSLFGIAVPQERLDWKKRTEHFLQSRTSDTTKAVLTNENHNADDDCSDDEVAFDSFPNLNHVTKFLIESKSFKELRNSLKMLAAKHQRQPLDTDSVRLDGGRNDQEFNADLMPFAGFRETLNRTLARLFRPSLTPGYRRLEWKCVSSCLVFYGMTLNVTGLWHNTLRRFLRSKSCSNR